MTKGGRGTQQQLTGLLTSCANALWARGAVLADVRPWGNRELAYRIRKQGVNHYQAQYNSLHVYCSPTALQEMEATLRNTELVLRHMTLKQRSLPPLDKATRKPHRVQRPPVAVDLECDPTEAARSEYRNLVMQRVFEGRAKQELVAEQLIRYKFTQNQRPAPTERPRSGLFVSSLRSPGQTPAVPSAEDSAELADGLPHEDPKQVDPPPGVER